MRAAAKRVALLAAVAVTASAVTFLGVRARAAGIPDTDVLTYTGYLENADGQALQSTVSIAVELWTDGAAGSGEKVCEAVAETVELQAGRFQVPLTDCDVEVKKSFDLWTEVRVDGASLGRTKLGAVPYAIEASHATSADTAAVAAHATSADTAATATEAIEAAHAVSADTVATARFVGKIGAKSYSVGLTQFCGATATKYLGNIGGSEVAKTHCETQCGSASTHMCTLDEIHRLAQLGAAPTTTGWISAYNGANGTPENMDCRGWTATGSGADDKRGTVWDNSGKGIGQTYCWQAPQPILCCD